MEHVRNLHDCSPSSADIPLALYSRTTLARFQGLFILLLGPQRGGLGEQEGMACLLAPSRLLYLPIPWPGAFKGRFFAAERFLAVSAHPEGKDNLFAEHMAAKPPYVQPNKNQSPSPFWGGVGCLTRENALICKNLPLKGLPAGEWCLPTCSPKFTYKTLCAIFPSAQ